ncbi:DUF4168 domain-containing protein [Fodinibius halophilus]|uniref:DUF4168 domain-containing protein n=1 Tax=Fodinibius halophilus TaxID=1736908 RepID=A0A6M1T7Z2_9BACT|nr:DUF4168 domain-containing protein [Fodinibius halophilus]NGP89545.1 DUF4168 domain-containing protein [Fodinibius halophilus]
MKIFKRSAVFILGFFLVAGVAFAQGQQMMQQQTAQPDSISDKELKKFATANQKMQKVRGDIQKKMMSEVKAALEDKEMDEQRFQQIMMSKRNKKADSINVTPKEEQTIKEIQPKLMKVQQGAQQQMMSVIQESGLNPQRFQVIMRAVQSNPEVMKRFQKITQDTMKKK